MNKKSFLNNKILLGQKKGAALVIALFLSLTAALLSVSFLSMSVTGAEMIINDKESKLAYYAAESGIAELENYLAYNDPDVWQQDLDETTLPDEANPVQLDNGSMYWVSKYEPSISGDALIVDIMGQFGDAQRKIRLMLDQDQPSAFDDYGLLTDGLIDINGNKTLKTSIHGNGGLSLSGPNNYENNAVSSQSIDSSKSAPDPTTNPTGGYVPPVDVPEIPFDYLREQALAGEELDIDLGNLEDQIDDTDLGSFIYINPSQSANYVYALKSDNGNGNGNGNGGSNGNGNSGSNGNGNSGSNGNGNSGDSVTLNLGGDMGGKVIFVEGDLNLNIDAGSTLSNCAIFATGTLTINGSRDIGTSHPGYIDVILASGEDITLNGSREFNALFWTDGSFRQNGSSMAGRVITQDGIRFNGSFTLEAADSLFDFDFIEKVPKIASRQLVPADAQ